MIQFHRHHKIKAGYLATSGLGEGLLAALNLLSYSDFSAGGTKYLTFTAVVAKREFGWDESLSRLKYQLIEEGVNNEEYRSNYFHACDDKQAVRDKVFSVIAGHLEEVAVHCVILEKCKTHPSLHSIPQSYALGMGQLLKYIFNGLGRHSAPSVEEVIVITDTIPVNKERKAVEKNIKTALAQSLIIKHKILHHPSASCFGLQVADYLSWAIYRKFDRNDLRSYDLIKPAVKSEFDLFRTSITKYY